LHTAYGEGGSVLAIIIKRIVQSGRIGSLLLAGVLSCFALSCRSRPQSDTAASAPQSIADEMGQADQLYSRRDDLTAVRQGIILLKQVRTNEPSNYDAAWKQSKFDYYLANHTEGDERDQIIRDGIESGKVAVKLQDDKPEGHFWLGANYGISAQASTLAGLASIDDIRNEMQKVLKINEGYQDGSAYMVLGLVDLEAPKMVGGDPQKAVGEMEKGLAFGKNNAFLRLHLAEAYLKVGRKNDATQQLNAIISMTPDQNYMPEYKEATAQAQKLLSGAAGGQS
jgi:tetratricopeptide (TPR) repeat protein